MLGSAMSVVLAEVVVGHPIMLGGWPWPGVDSGRWLSAGIGEEGGDDVDGVAVE